MSGRGARDAAPADPLLSLGALSFSMSDIVAEGVHRPTWFWLKGRDAELAQPVTLIRENEVAPAPDAQPQQPQPPLVISGRNPRRPNGAINDVYAWVPLTHSGAPVYRGRANQLWLFWVPGRAVWAVGVEPGTPLPHAYGGEALGWFVYSAQRDLDVTAIESAHHAEGFFEQDAEVTCAIEVAAAPLPRQETVRVVRNEAGKFGFRFAAHPKRRGGIVITAASNPALLGRVGATVVTVDGLDARGWSFAVATAAVKKGRELTLGLELPAVETGPPSATVPDAAPDTWQPQQQQAPCAYTSEAKGDCTGVAEADSKFCTRHACPRPECGARKPSSQRYCVVHQAEADAGADWDIFVAAGEVPEPEPEIAPDAAHEGCRTVILDKQGAKLGMRIKHDDGVVRVVSLAEGGVAAKSRQLSVGQQIIAANGQRTSSIDKATLMGILRTSAVVTLAVCDEAPTTSPPPERVEIEAGGEAAKAPPPRKLPEVRAEAVDEDPDAV